MGKQGVRIVELQPAAWYAVQDKTVFPLESEDLLRLLDNKDVTLDVFDSAPLYARAMAAGGWGSSIGTASWRPICWTPRLPSTTSRSSSSATAPTPLSPVRSGRTPVRWPTCSPR